MPAHKNRVPAERFELSAAVNEAITQMNAVQHALTAIVMLALAATGCGGEAKSLLDFERPGIDKIAHLTAKEHSAILFTVGDYIIGYAKEGRTQWINSTDRRARPCGWPHPALAHDGSRVAFVSDSDTPTHCRITIHDTSTGEERQLIDVTDDPGEISWSWDDSEIAFFDHGIWAVSVRDGTKRVLLSSGGMKIDDRQFVFWVWYPMQWLHNGELVAELQTEIPQKEPGTYVEQSNLLLVKDGSARVIDIGSRPSVSPVSNRIAYYAGANVVVINSDGTAKNVLAKAPTQMLVFKEDLFGNIVWSPDGSRIFFGTIVSESRSDKLYLLNVQSGRREEFLSHTSITIRGWH
jgi:hypothetical protein